MFLQPERVPVKVYLSTDKDAPRLDRTAGSLLTILKACLVTGYGDKEGAGWTMPFEDTTRGLKVFRPEISPHTDFFMKVSNDTGREATVQVYQNMTSVDNGELKLQCGTPFKYGIQQSSSKKWLLIASGRSFWFFHETGATDRNGTFLFCGDTAKNTTGQRRVAIYHTGGRDATHVTRHDFFENADGWVSVSCVAMSYDSDSIDNMIINSLFDGSSQISTNAVAGPVVIRSKTDFYALHCYSSSNNNAVNYQEIKSHGRTFINHSPSTQKSQNLFIPTDYWEY